MSTNLAPSTHVSVATDARLASAHVDYYDATDEVRASFTAHMTNPKGISCWTCTFTAPDASDLLALLAPVVDRLRAMAADELVAMDEFADGVVAGRIEVRP